jgi:Mlc titration factor MtfA (ptsG expression regulator)
VLFPWSRERHRRELLATSFPEAWRSLLFANVAFYGHLTPAERSKLEDNLRILIAEKNWEGLSGLAITDEIQVTIAAQACLLTLARERSDYYHVGSILVYPTAYVIPSVNVQGRIVTETVVPVEGEAALSGHVVLSWHDALAGGRGLTDGRNVVFHEFAHQLDMEAGTADGVPPLDTQAQVENWSQVFSAEFQALTTALAHGHPTFLNPYAATNAAEFFAVATEYFFERGAAMQHHHPELYDALRGFYHQDPATSLNSHIDSNPTQ